MRTIVRIAGIALCALTACNYTEGECWIDGDGVGTVGVGGGPIVPGAGGFGEVPPEPQGAGDIPPPDCNIEKDNPCNEKCLSDYIAAAEQCTEIKDAAQKAACDDNAHTRYVSCRENCQKAFNECYDKCDAIAEKERQKCEKMAPGPGRAKCQQAVQEQWIACYAECRKKK
ncbi:MAG: hypothetical protein IPK82_08150 [Polyangiaceae bacterium]|nr:hypothetical protein [Polyangiaceae bacterium]